MDTVQRVSWELYIFALTWLSLRVQLSGDGSEGIIEISGPDQSTVQKAKDMILRMLEEPEVGKIYR